jgi:hypothetical protein
MPGDEIADKDRGAEAEDQARGNGGSDTIRADMERHQHRRMRQRHGRGIAEHIGFAGMGGGGCKHHTGRAQQAAQQQNEGPQSFAGQVCDGRALRGHWPSASWFCM